ncbi:GNAT family N-acetyltransferase [Microvirga sp. SRT01]|uniref:GNAT family N-acetyltransferase n=1 Tax=Sphingomonas longa TaxID=2778730 RepID=A0ABS2DBP4_9SPHN|nr:MULTISPECIES: GNAT family N-acetyltransferase [Alphaproteobacteria]MBM6578359.1 GNAT family N-acetyltransferase [Sphingomonas sp. BT552]MBR7711400.1 GNAT family N-acetyltransferase [Microvirga sp. SRT01]
MATLMPVDRDHDDALREAAAHRGMKLVKSRRRKPGAGDYGKYGLTDTGGQALLGIGDNGLTATADDVRRYLRKAEGSTWAASADVTPVRLPPRPVVEKAEEEESAETIVAARKPRQVQQVKEREPEPEPKPEPEPEPEPELRVRPAVKGDLKAVAALLDAQHSESVSADRFDALRRSGGGVLVADRGGVIGCVAWHLILGLHAPPIGRITAIVVDRATRRRGVGRAMFDAAVAAMVDQGCGSVEAVGAIAVRNANGFYRAVGLGQEGYRFVRDVGE